MRIPRVLTIFRQSWIYFLGLIVTAVVLLIWYQLDPSTPWIILR